MTNGYQQFFKKAQENANISGPNSNKPKPKIRRFDIKLAATPPKSKPSMSGPETRQAMMDELRNRMKKKPKKLRKKVPIHVLAVAFLGLFASGVGLWKYDLVEKYAKNVEVSMMTYAGAEEKSATAKKEEAPASPVVTDAKTEAAPAVPLEPVKHEYTDEEINHFSKLNERKRELDAHEEELNRLEAELAKQKTELEKRLKDLENTRRQISSVLEEKVKADDTKVEALVQMYSNMKPQQAAKIFETMDEDLAIDILGRMKKKPAAEILNLVKSEKAQILSEKFAGYKRP